MKILSAFLLVCVLPGVSHAEIITFDFEDAAGAGGDLSGQSSASTTSSSGGITLTLSASIPDFAGSLIGTFNRTNSGGFGINATGAGDSTTDLDNGSGVPESFNFQISSNVALQDLTLVSFEFESFTNGDEGAVFLNGSSIVGVDQIFEDSDLSGSNVLTLNQSGLTATDVINLAHVSGNGFGLEFITFDATIATVPEPGTWAAGVFLVFAGVHRWRQHRRAVSAS